MQTPKKYNFLLEESPTPIYLRIIKGFSKALTQVGHGVKLINPTRFQHDLDYIHYIQNENIDYCIITNSVSRLSLYSEEIKCFLFEAVNKKIIFVHHDNIFSDLCDPIRIRLRLEAFQKIKNNSFHFCIEYFNFLDLKKIGIENTYHILHTSDFEYLISEQKNYCYNLSFVGHVLPEIGNYFDHLPYSHLIKADFWNRIVCLDTKLEQSAISFANRSCINRNSLIDLLTVKYFYISMLHATSQFFRGELIKRIENLDIDIFGGDPAYLQGISINRNIQKQGVKYHPPTSDYSETKYIYANSKINLNITSLQFDEAVINRVIDIGAVGGFVLTDWKSDLRKITSMHEEISYRTIDELNYKINYYLSHESERLEIAEQLHQDVKKNCTYHHVVNFIFSKISLMSKPQSETLRLDLGCGSWKPEGFVGIDISDRLGVDVVADLTRRFPFPDSSVDEVRAHDIIEHLPDRIHTMNEIWRICKPGAKIDIRVPSTDGRGAFQDPTHVSFWNINSFNYYCLEFPVYIELCKSYGFQGAFSIVSLAHEESSERVIHVKAILIAVKTAEVDSTDIFIKNQLQLREINLVVFPDWCQPQENLALTMGNVIRAVATHPDKSRITLLIDTSNISDEDAELALSGVVMNLLLEEDLDVADGPEISLIGNIDETQWQALVPRLFARILLEKENQQAIAQVKAETIPICELNSFSQKRVAQSDIGI